MGDNATAVRRTALALVGLVTVVLGWWGFVVYSGLHPAADLGWPEWLYGTMNLFINGTDVAPVPWQLGMARMLAPLVTFGLLLEVVLVAFAQRIRRSVESNGPRSRGGSGGTGSPLPETACQRRRTRAGRAYRTGRAIAWPGGDRVAGDVEPGRVGGRHSGSVGAPHRARARSGRPHPVGTSGSP